MRSPSEPALKEKKISKDWALQVQEIRDVIRNQPRSLSRSSQRIRKKIWRGQCRGEPSSESPKEGVTGSRCQTAEVVCEGEVSHMEALETMTKAILVGVGAMTYCSGLEREEKERSWCTSKRQLIWEVSVQWKREKQRRNHRNIWTNGFSFCFNGENDSLYVSRWKWVCSKRKLLRQKLRVGGFCKKPSCLILRNRKECSRDGPSCRQRACMEWSPGKPSKLYFLRAGH